MNTHPNYKQTEADLLVQQVDGALKSFRKLPKKKRVEFYGDLQCAEREIRNKKVAAVVMEILDVMHIELFGVSKRWDYKKRMRTPAAEKPIPLESSFNVFKIAEHAKFKSAHAAEFKIAKRSSSYRREGYRVDGESLSGLGIHHGDMIICNNSFTAEEIPGQLCVLRYLGTDEIRARLVFPNYDGTATLKSANPDYSDYTMKLEEFEVVAIAKKVQHDINPIDITPPVEAGADVANKVIKFTCLGK